MDDAMFKGLKDDVVLLVRREHTLRPDLHVTLLAKPYFDRTKDKDPFVYGGVAMRMKILFILEKGLRAAQYRHGEVITVFQQEVDLPHEGDIKKLIQLALDEPDFRFGDTIIFAKDPHNAIMFRRDPQ